MQLRVLWGDESELSPAESEKAALIAKRPELAWRMREFFENWFGPRYLWRKGREVSRETVRNHRCTLRYWESITDDWRLVDFLCDRDGADAQALDFTDQLPEWGYSRRGMRRGEPIRIGRLADNPSFTPLKSMTGGEHAARMARLFRVAGPESHRDNRHHYAELLTRVPRVEILPRSFDEKEPFAWPIAQQIAAACGRMTRPVLPAWMPCELWWRVRLATLYYTGLRMGTVVKLCWSHAHDLDGTPVLKVPKELIKTRKKIEMPLHPQLAGYLRQVRGLRPRDWPDELLIPEGCQRRYLLDLHEELQVLAAIPDEQRQSFHAWRRTHLTQICELGAGRGLELAQAAADHSDGRTTARHYISVILNHFRLRLPLLFD